MESTNNIINTEPNTSCAGKISQESVRLNCKKIQDSETIAVLQTTNSINDIPAWKGKALFDEENTGLNKNWFRRL